MKRLHVHVAVDDLARSIRFYTTLFAAEPSVARADYAKWMLDDPRVNFAVSRRGSAAGVQHLGIQVETALELREVQGRLQRAEGPVLEEPDAVCCYAKSRKSWIGDPQRVAWETFLTTGESTVYGDGGDLDAFEGNEGEPCCTATTPQGICCPPKPERSADAPCCGGV